MKELEALIARRWVLKTDDAQLYYRVRDALGEIRAFATEKMGCQIIENALLVKMEKIPVIAEPSMGIAAFSSKEEYAFLCIVLMFLEDYDVNEKFILSQLTEYVAANMPGGNVDWTHYKNRQQLVRVLKYAGEQGLIRVTDGSEEDFMAQEDGEVLYENTGVSRYFMRAFPHDIMTYTKPQDFERSDWLMMDEERGIARRHRVYKRLLFSVGLLQSEGAEEDVDYLIRFGYRLADDLEKHFDVRLDIQRGNAFLMQGEECRMGDTLPGDKGISDVLLLLCTKIREEVMNKRLVPEKDDRIQLTKVALEQLIRQVRQEQGEGFTQTLRKMTDGAFVEQTIEEMEYWQLVRVDSSTQMATILPAAGKIAGRYPNDYQGGKRRE